MNTINKKEICRFLSASVLIIALSCAGIYAEDKNVKTIQTESGTVTEYTLTNGIPVYVDHSSANQIDALYIAVKGGTAHLTPDTSGLENALFTMMARSSAKYDFAARQKLLFDKRASINVLSIREGTALYLSCIDYYFDDMLPALVDGFMNPSFEQKVYDNTMTEYNQNIQSMMNNPESLLQYKASQIIYKDHPYLTSSGVTPDSINNITIDNMKKLLPQILDASSLFVVAAGPLDGNKLIELLNKTIGMIPASGKVPDVQNIQPVALSGEPVVLTHSSAAGTGFIARVFASPVVTSDDFMPAAITADIYSSILYNVVREKHGACYTPYSDIDASMAPVGMEMLYRASNLTGFVPYMDEARTLMVQGKLIDYVNPDGSYSYTTIEDRLEGYKNSFINRTYSSQETTAGVAGRLCRSMLRYGDVTASERLTAKVKDVTAGDVARVFKKYWVDGSSRWFAVVGPDDEKKIQF
jgi:zinc protease